MKFLRILKSLLRCYPRAFRERFEAEMAVYLEEEVSRNSAFPNIVSICLDLGCSALAEHWVERKSCMKIKNHSLSLLVAALIANLGSLFALLFNATSGLVLVYLASLLLFIRLALEWKRPAREWWRIAGMGFVLAVAYGAFLPAWAKTAQEVGAPRLIPILVIAPFLLTIALGMLKGVMLLINRTPPRAV